MKSPPADCTPHAAFILEDCRGGPLSTAWLCLPGLLLTASNTSSSTVNHLCAFTWTQASCAGILSVTLWDKKKRDINKDTRRYVWKCKHIWLVPACQFFCQLCRKWFGTRIRLTGQFCYSKNRVNSTSFLRTGVLGRNCCSWKHTDSGIFSLKLAWHKWQAAMYSKLVAASHHPAETLWFSSSICVTGKESCCLDLRLVDVDGTNNRGTSSEQGLRGAICDVT